MKRNSAWIVAILLVFIFLFFMFTYTVRQNELVLVQRGSDSTEIRTPGLKFRLPAPFHKIFKFDNRTYLLETDYSQVNDTEKTLMMQVYVAWKIDGSNPKKFQTTFQANNEQGMLDLAEGSLRKIVDTVRSSVVGQNQIGSIISSEAGLAKIDELENKMSEKVKLQAKENYGIDVQFLGVRRVGLPKSNIDAVLKTMSAQRLLIAENIRREGRAEADKILATATNAASTLISDAKDQLTRERGKADAERAEAFQRMERNPELAVFLKKLKALEESLKGKSTLILDDRTQPFDLLRGFSTNFTGNK